MTRIVLRAARRSAAVIAVAALVVVGLPPFIDVVAPRSPAPAASGPVDIAGLPPSGRPRAPSVDRAGDRAGEGAIRPTSERSDRSDRSADAEQSSSAAADQPVRDSDLPPLSAPIVFDSAADTALGRIVIPAIGVDAAFAEGVHDTALTGGPGHWPGTPLPTQPGNAVLSGHRTTFTAPFGDLDLLAAGDEIRTAVGPQAATYRVTGVEIVPEAEYVDRVLRPADASDAVLTLFACHPKGSRTHRIVVTAQA